MNRSHSWLRAVVFATALLASSIGLHAIAAAPQEGIKVHGDWTIVIRNADGSIASRNEFKNALVPVGAGNLASVLAGNSAIGTWMIYFEGGGICTTFNSGCVISTPRYALPSILASNNLTITAGTGADYGKLFLVGSLKAIGAGSIGQVATLVMPCAASTPTCSSGVLSDFSQRTLSPAISVVAGQTVDITVVFSFS